MSRQSFFFFSFSLSQRQPRRPVKLFVYKQKQTLVMKSPLAENICTTSGVNYLFLSLSCRMPWINVNDVLRPKQPWNPDDVEIVLIDSRKFTATCTQWLTKLVRFESTTAETNQNCLHLRHQTTFQSTSIPTTKATRNKLFNMFYYLLSCV